MGLKFATKINRIRVGAGTALAFFDLAIGVAVDGAFTPLVVAKDFALRDGSNGKWIASPSRKYDKDGEVKYANYFEFFAEKKGEKWTTTPQARKLQDAVVAQVVEALTALNASSGGGNRGSKPEGTPTGVAGGAKSPGIFDGDDAGGEDFDLF